MELLELPTELLLCIFEHIDSFKDMNALCQASRALYELFNDELHRLYVVTHGNMGLIKAVVQGQGTTAKRFINWGADIEERDIEIGRTPLIWASVRKDVAIVMMLLKVGAMIDRPDLYGRTPLWWAAYHGRTDIARVLIQNGAKVDTWDIEGQTAVFACSQCMNLESRVQMLHLLLSKGARPLNSEDI